MRNKAARSLRLISHLDAEQQCRGCHMDADAEVEPYHIVPFIFGSCVFCENCKCEPDYASCRQKYCDDNYYDQAVAMKRAGWTVIGQVAVLCPHCSRRQSEKLNP